MKTIVKICGITNLEDALDVVDCGADALGFNFYQGSKRFVTPELVHEIVAKLPCEVMKTGVFVNESIEHIAEIVRKAKLNGVQLHGEETPEFVDQLRSVLSLPIIKAFRVSSVQVIEEIVKYRVEGVLLDANSTKDRGGTGETFDWNIAKLAADIHPRTYLAGGLSHENVADAIGIVKSFAVDACSLLENEPGKKDRFKVARFVTAAKGAI